MKVWQAFQTFVDSQNVVLKNQKDAFEISWESKISKHENIDFQEFQENLELEKRRIDKVQEDIVKKELESLNNLEKQKIGRLKNFFIKVFTFGKVNKNKKIEQEITKIKHEKSWLEETCKNFNDYLKKKNNAVFNKMIKRHNQVIERKNKLIKENEELHKQVSELNKEKKHLNQENSDLKSENQTYKEFQESINQQKVDKFLTLNNTIKSLEQEKQFWKDNYNKLERTNSQDSGVEIGYEAKETENKETQTTEENLNNSFKVGRNSILKDNYPDEKNPFSEEYPEKFNPFTEQNETLIFSI